MEVVVPGKVRRLKDVPAGGVFGFFIERQYLRFLRTATENTDRELIAIVSLGPFSDGDYAGNVQGPTVYMWEADEKVVYEKNTTMRPKLDTMVDAKSQHIKLGSVVLSEDENVCILCRTPRGGRALIDLINGGTIKDNSGVVAYEQYSLVMPGEEEPKMRVIFDSSEQATSISTAA